MSPQDLRALVDYHYWAGDRMLAAVEQLAAATRSHEREPPPGPSAGGP